uniref:Integrase catalytic domain-containing protein n=1 Tax=Chromera velia CCMP2878 TaxID=1169474 RepID=A0A0G4GI69_9ALVE|eukprot:Cvel_4740.t1-p1 / transcript=Cvel_4740.t1 / gene=Cvel_4740 / organism=Chromera_velia_CCMP2878 / gene_product=Putative transposon Ty5-1 protein YCL074W, putative / transcript_product=Putative transposon Ty5-1 protein YCL074W, putative / location=Cvel_scaffold211:28522-32178(-) / protein_length=1219 / sequence_SO=supercontig / SO=protein_coding / is_pseudo=false
MDAGTNAPERVAGASECYANTAGVLRDPVAETTGDSDTQEGDASHDGCDHPRQIDGDAIDSGRVSTRAGVPQRLRRKERMRLGDVAMRELVEQAHHQTGHIGGAALRRMLSRHFANPKLPSLCREVIEQCEECAQVKGASHRWREWTGKLRIGRPLERVAVNIHYINSKSYVTMIDECTRWLVVVPVKGENAETVWAAVKDNWLRMFSLPLGLRSCFKTDHGSHFKGVFDLNCSKIGIMHEWTPVGHPQSNGILENCHEVLDTQITLLRLEREIEMDQVDDILPLAVALVNRLPYARAPYQSPYERMTGVSFLPACVEETVKGELWPRMKESNLKTAEAFREGDLVLFRHPLRKFGNVEEEWKPYTIVSRLSPTRYQLKPRRACDRSYEGYKIDAHVSAMRIMPEKMKKRLESPDSTQAEKKEEGKERGRRKKKVELQDKRFVVWKNDEKKQLFLGEVLQEKRTKLLVHYYGSYGRGSLADRIYRPAVKRKGEQAVMFTSKKRKSLEPDIYEVEKDEIAIERAQLQENGRLAQGTVEEILKDYVEEKEFALSTTIEEPTFNGNASFLVSGLLSHLGFSTASTDDHQTVKSALLTATTHQKVKYSELTQTQKAKCDKARRNEFAKLMKYQTYEPVRRDQVPEGVRIIDMLVVDTLKLKPEGEREFKARAVARGDQDTRQDIDTAMCGCPPDSVRFVLLAALGSPHFNEDSIASVDCQNAYLQAKLRSPRPVFVCPPKCYPDYKMGVLWKLKKALYGLKDAGRLFEDHLWDLLQKLGWEASPLTGVFWKKKVGRVVGLLSQYVDDLIVVSLDGSISEMVTEIAEVVECKEPERLGRYVGSDYEILPNGRIWCSQKQYIESIPGEQSKTPTQPLPSGVNREEDKSETLDAEGHKRYRQLLGELSYAAHCTRPDLEYASAWLSQFNQSPTVRAWRLLNRAIKYGKATSNRGILLDPPKHHEPMEVLLYCDAAGGSDEYPHPQTGWVLLINGRPIAWKSRKQKRFARSSNRGELMALEDALDYGLVVMRFIKEIWRDAGTKCVIRTDSDGVCKMLKARNPKPQERALVQKVREIGGKVSVIPALAVFDSLKEGKIAVQHVSGVQNYADSLTKPMSVDLLASLLEKEKAGRIIYTPTGVETGDEKEKEMNDDDSDDEFPWPPQAQAPGRRDTAMAGEGHQTDRAIRTREEGGGLRMRQRQDYKAIHRGTTTFNTGVASAPIQFAM